MMKRIICSLALIALSPSAALASAQTITRSFNGFDLTVTFDPAKQLGPYLIKSTYLGASRHAALSCSPGGSYDWVSYGDEQAEFHSAAYDAFGREICK